MNTPNNRRRRESREKMEGVFVRLLQDQQLEEITVTDICKGARVNRTTFYANYQDIYGLADAVRSRLQQEVWGLFGEQNAENLNDPFLTLFRHIRENQLFYKSIRRICPHIPVELKMLPGEHCSGSSGRNEKGIFAFNDAVLDYLKM